MIARRACLRQMRIWWVPLVPLAVLQQACTNHQAQDLRFAPIAEFAGGESILWQRNGWQLGQAADARSTDHSPFSPGPGLMVAAQPLQGYQPWPLLPLAESQSDSGGRESPPRTGSSLEGSAMVYAAFRVHSDADLETLATFVHERSGLCGNLQRVDEELGVLGGDTDDDALPPGPVIPEFVRVPTIDQILARVNAGRMEDYIQSLQNMGTRYFRKQSGIQTPTWIMDQMRTILDREGVRYELRGVDHSGFEQQSVVLALPGTRDDNTTVIVGAHLDSINNWNQDDAPGADDNATGVATLLELVHLVAEGDLSFDRRVEFHAYAAEEIGLLGSFELAKDYSLKERIVAGMLQLDMTGYLHQGDENIYLITTDTSPSLTSTLLDLGKAYLDGKTLLRPLEAGTSDHKSWSDRGFAAAFAFEDPDHYNHRLHTADDELEALNATHSARFAKLAMAYLAHVAGTSGAGEAAYDKVQALQNTFSRDARMALHPPDGAEAGDDVFAYVATPLTATRVDLCPVTARASASCLTSRRAMSLVAQTSARRFFALDSMVRPTQDPLWQALVYDEANNLIDRRVVEFAR